MPPKKKQKKSQSPAAPRRSNNWTKPEDIFICIAYANVTEDPLVGNNQKSRVFWNRVYKMFKELVSKRKNELEDWVKDVDREEMSMKVRFSKQIAKFVLLYNPFYKREKESKPSGTNEEDIRIRAMEKYEEQLGEAFKFPHCLDELWKVPKFQPMQEIVEVGWDDESRSTPTLKSEGGVNNTLSVMGGNLSRPIGTKAAKQQLKEDRSVAALDATRTESISSMAQSHKRLAASYEKKVDLKEIAEMRENIKFLLELGENEEAAALRLVLKERLKPKQFTTTTTTSVSTISSPAEASELTMNDNQDYAEVVAEEVLDV